MRERLLREEKGFTLTEVMVSMIVMIIVLFSLYSVFDMGLRVFSFGNDKVEAVENARLGLEKMDREIQAAYAYDKGMAAPAAATPDAHLFDTWTATQIRFGNDLDGNRIIECPATAPPACEKITYQVYETPAGSGNYALGRDNSNAGTNLQPVVEYVDGSGGRTFIYLKADGATPAATEGEIAMVRIALRIKVEGGARPDGRQTLTTDVALRNRGNG